MRSRLEARTAESMDAHGIQWEYESQGFDLGGGVWYLPDFWCPGIRTFVECKGVMMVDDLRKIDLLARVANGLPRDGQPAEDDRRWLLRARDAVRVVVVTGGGEEFDTVPFAPAMCGEFAYEGWGLSPSFISDSILSGVGEYDDRADLVRCGACGEHSWSPRWWTWACVACGLGADVQCARRLPTRLPPRARWKVRG